VWLANTVNQQRAQILTNEHLRYLQHQLQDMRDHINDLLHKLDCHELPSMTDNVADDSRAASPGGGGGSEQSVYRLVYTASSSNAAAGSLDQLTKQIDVLHGCTTASADTGRFHLVVVVDIIS